MKNLKLAAVCLSCLTMTGCSALNFSVEGLINAPKLTSEQSEIHQALIESVGSNITLKYPKNGEYRSAYVIANIDDEPTDEAMVFYEYTSNGSEEDGLRVNILDKDEDGKWYSVKELAGAGTDIDQVIISPMEAITRRTFLWDIKILLMMKRPWRYTAIPTEISSVWRLILIRCWSLWI